MSPIWLLDYDRTLYGPRDEHVFASICLAISRHLERRLSLPPAEASARRAALCAAHGSTLRGMVAEHGESPEAYFDAVHADAVITEPASNPALQAALSSLPGTRHVFTNSRRDWAERGLAALGVSSHIERIFDLRWSGWRGKPDPRVYAQVAAALGGGDERRIIFLDDSLGNLLPARSRGWRCVWVHPPADAAVPEGIEVLERIEDVAALAG